MKKIDVSISRQARPISVTELDEHCPEKIELIQGYLSGAKKRLGLLALLLANVGIDKAISLRQSGKVEDSD